MHGNILALVCMVALSASGNAEVLFNTSLPRLMTRLTPLNATSQPPGVEVDTWHGVVETNNGFMIASTSAIRHGLEIGYASRSDIASSSSPEWPREPVVDSMDGPTEGCGTQSGYMVVSPDGNAAAFFAAGDNDYNTPFFVFNESTGVTTGVGGVTEPGSGMPLEIISKNTNPCWLSNEVVCGVVELARADGSNYADEAIVCHDQRTGISSLVHGAQEVYVQSQEAGITRVAENVGCFHSSIDTTVGTEPHCFNLTDPSLVPVATTLADVNPGANYGSTPDSTPFMCAGRFCFAGRTDANFVNRMACIDVETGTAHTSTDRASDFVFPCLDDKVLVRSLSKTFLFDPTDGSETDVLCTESGGSDDSCRPTDVRHREGTVVAWVRQGKSGTSEYWITALDLTESAAFNGSFRRAQSPSIEATMPRTDYASALQFSTAGTHSIAIATRNAGGDPTITEITQLRGLFGTD